MNLPKSVKVGYLTYRIVPWNSHEANGAGRLGETVHETRTIKIEMTHEAPHTAEALLHEIIHCVFDVFNIEDDDDQERTTTALGSGLATVWHDNPELMAWIGKSLR